MVEATGVSPEAPISPQDLGLWNDAQVEPFSAVVAAIRAGGAVPAVQLAHAGRKASTAAPWNGGGYVDENVTVGLLSHQAQKPSPTCLSHTN